VDAAEAGKPAFTARLVIGLYASERISCGVTWSFTFAVEEVKAEFDAPPLDMRVQFEHIVRLVQQVGIEWVHEPFIRDVGDELREIRLQGRIGIARALYLNVADNRIAILRVFVKWSKKTPHKEIRLAQARHRAYLTTKLIPVAVSFTEWRNDIVYRAAYEALNNEFSFATAMIEARSKAGLSQEQLAQCMKTTKVAVARLESGRVKPSTRTLERVAAATGTRLRFSFEPASAG
jgi:phage-related protein/DNA-binding XRE family transcriptional regulator